MAKSKTFGQNLYMAGQDVITAGIGRVVFRDNYRSCNKDIGWQNHNCFYEIKELVFHGIFSIRH